MAFPVWASGPDSLLITEEEYEVPPAEVCRSIEIVNARVIFCESVPGCVAGLGGYDRGRCWAVRLAVGSTGVRASWPQAPRSPRRALAARSAPMAGLVRNAGSFFPSRRGLPYMS